MKREDCKLGMRVLAVAPCDGLNGLVGKFGTIRVIRYSEPCIGVEFDSPFKGGHSLDGVLPRDSSRGRWCESKSLESIDGVHISIDSDGIKTDIHAAINGRVVDKTVRVASGDTPNSYVGALMALNKAFGVHLGRAKTGENVIVINPIHTYDYSLGDVVRMENDEEGTLINNATPVMLFAEEYAIIDDISMICNPGKTRKAVCVSVDKSGSPFVVGNVYVVDQDNTISVAGRKTYLVPLNSSRENWLVDAGKNKFIVINEDGKNAD